MDLTLRARCRNGTEKSGLSLGLDSSPNCSADEKPRTLSRPWLFIFAQLIVLRALTVTRDVAVREAAFEQVLLMVRLGAVEFRGGLDLRDDRPLKPPAPL